jgi:hypothetical protein
VLFQVKVMMIKTDISIKTYFVLTFAIPSKKTTSYTNGGQIDLQAKLLGIFGTTHAIVMILFVSNVLWVRESIPTSHKCVTFTDDLEIQGHVMLYLTFTNFGSVCPGTIIFCF